MTAKTSRLRTEDFVKRRPDDHRDPNRGVAPSTAPAGA